MPTVDLHQPAIPINYARQLVELCSRWHVAPQELMEGTALARLDPRRQGGRAAHCRSKAGRASAIACWLIRKTWSRR